MGGFTELDEWAALPEMGLRVNKLGYELAVRLSARKDARNAYEVKVCYQHHVNCCLQLRRCNERWLDIEEVSKGDTDGRLKASVIHREAILMR